MNDELRFNKNGRFRILQLTDLHYKGEDIDDKTLNLVKELIEEQNPDLIVLTGDIFHAVNTQQQVRDAIDPIIKSGVPYAIVFGNHDAECMSKEDIYKVIKESNTSLMQKGPTNITGVGNYRLDIFDGQQLMYALYFFDSGEMNQDDRVGGFDYIHHDQIQWYINDYRALCEVQDMPIKAMSFFHIALREYSEVWLKGDCIGEKRQQFYCSNVNSGLYSAMLEQGNMKAIFVGHDHENDFIGELYGIMLGFGRLTGYNCNTCDTYKRGARVIEIGRHAISTWITLNDGKQYNYTEI